VVEKEKYKCHIEETERAKKINNEVWKIILKHLGFYDFIDQVIESDLCTLLEDLFKQNKYTI
jgi:hypothetical protein